MREFPKKGLDAEEVMEKMEEYALDDFDPHSKRMWGHIYYAGQDELIDLARKAYLMFMDKTMLDFTTFPSLLRMENELIGMTADLLNGDENVVGNFTYGGTESIMLAMKSARERFRKTRGKDVVPEIVLSATTHPSFWKSANFLGMRVRRAGMDDKFRGDVDEINELISDRTAAVIGSAPNYPFGVVDDIKALSDISVERDLWLHVDACMGAFVLPFFKMLGEKIPDFDFSVEGVSSISADYHKYGFSPRGASAVLYRNSSLREGQIFVMASWPGYPLVNTAVLSTRSAGTLAAAWAVVNYLGIDGYLRLAEKILYAKKKLIRGMEELGFELMGNPEGPIFAFKSDNLNLFQISSIMAEMGWYVQSQPGSKHLNFPKSLHFSVTPAHAEMVDDFLEDMKKAVSIAGSEYPDVSEFDLSKLEFSKGEIPENMEVINELIHSFPPETVESIFRYVINEFIFKP